MSNANGKDPRSTSIVWLYARLEYKVSVCVYVGACESKRDGFIERERERERERDREREREEKEGSIAKMTAG